MAAVVEHDGKVLLARNKAWPDTWYALVAGFLERDEAPEDAVLREVKEEVGLDGGPPRLIGVYPFARMNQVILAYHVATTGQITLGDELVDYKLVRPGRMRRVARRHRVGAARLAPRAGPRTRDDAIFRGRSTRSSDSEFTIHNSELQDRRLETGD